MNNFILLVRTKITALRASISTLNLIRTLSFIFVFGSFLGGSYYLFFRVFNYLLSVEIIGPVLMNKILQMAFFIFFIMLLLSNVITSMSTFYNNRELQFLFSLPISPSSIYLAKFFENCLYASWATMIIILPFITAYGVTTRAPIIYYPVSIISVMVYLIIPGAIATGLIFIIRCILPKLKSRDVIMLLFGLLLSLTFFYLRVNNPALLKVFATESQQDLLKFVENLTAVGGIYVPSTWLSYIIVKLSQGSSQSRFYLLLLLSVTSAIMIIAFYLARLFYTRSWILVGEYHTQARKKGSPLNRYYGSTKTFLLKDILIFIREPIQWIQLTTFFILLIIYIFSLRKTPIYFTIPVWRTIVSFANFAYICFILATLGVRFIFPSISLERYGVWLISSSPISFGRIIKIKYLFNFFVAVIIIEGLLFFSNLLIKTDLGFYIILPIIGIFVAGSLVSINLGLGAYFSQFNEDNPSRIASGTGGIIAALASIGYVGITIAILALPAYNYLSNIYFRRPLNYPLIILSITGFLVFNIFTILGPLYLGIRSFEKRDI